MNVAQSPADILSSLTSGAATDLPLAGCRVRAVDLFDIQAVEAMISANPDSPRIIAVFDPAHVEPFAAEMSADARILVSRLMPGPIAGVLTASPMVPPPARYSAARVAVTTPLENEVRNAIRELGHPILCCLEDSCETGDGPTIIDISGRPAHILRPGRLEREHIGRYVLLDSEA